MITRQKILVTGANGQLGRSLRDIAPGFPQYEFLFVSREVLAVEDGDNLQQYFKENRPQWLVNCAAYTAVDKAESEKVQAMKVNGEAVGMMAAVTKENHCGFIHISTDYVFDGNATSPYMVDHPVSPQNEYGRTKLEGERLAFKFNPETILIRSSWIYSEHGNNFVKTMIRLMKERDSINVVSDQLGSPTYARDLAEAIMMVIKNIKSSLPSQEPKAINPACPAGRHQPCIYHFSNKGIISWYDFAVAIKEIIGLSCIINPIATSQYPTPAKRPAYSAMDTERITKEFDLEIKGWKESLVECLKRMSH